MLRAALVNICRSADLAPLCVSRRLVATSAAKARKKVKLSEVTRLIEAARSEKWHIAGAMGLLVVSSSVTMAVPFCMGKVIDVITAYDGEERATMVTRLTDYSKILLAVFIAGGIANAGRIYMIRMSGQRIVRDIRKSLFSSIMRKEVAFFDRTRTGELVNRLSADTLMVGEALTTNIADGLRSCVQVAGGVGMMLYVSPKLTILSLGIVPVLGGSMVFYGRFVKSITQRVQSSLAEASQEAEERIANVRTVRAFAQEKNEAARYGTFVDNVLQLARKDALARAIFFGVTGFSGNVIVLTVFFCGGLMMNEAALTMGELSAFLLYAAYAGMSIGGLSSFYSEFNRALGASTRIWQLIDDTSTVEKSGSLIPSHPIQGHLTFENIHFSYASRTESPLFSGLSLEAPPGSILALVGRSGSGKSTIGALLLRLYDPQEGIIRMDGQDIRDFDLQWWRQQIGSVSQDPVLFSCSIAENIAYGLRDVSAARIEAAAAQANALSFIRDLPQSFDTLVGERGVLLSGGQRQRVAIARAIIREPSVLLLDEATSALDSSSEKEVQAALQSVMRGRTVVTIAHRLSTIRNADQVALLEAGAVAERGTYAQLMGRSDGLFRQLVERQMLGLGASP